MTHTTAEIEAHVQLLMPKATPAWITSFVAWLQANLPALIALIMALIPAAKSPAQVQALSALAAIHDAQGPPKAKGPMFDPFVASAMAYFKQFVATNGPKAYDVAEAWVEHQVSALTP